MEVFFFILLIVVLAYIARTHQLAEKINRLEQQVDDLAPALSRLSLPAPTVQPTSVPMPKPTIQPTSVPLPKPTAQPISPTIPEAIASPKPPSLPLAPGESTSLPSWKTEVQPTLDSLPPSTATGAVRTSEEWELLVGGKLLNRIGAFALVLGLGFFLKYAFDNNWITETMRVMIGLIAGAGLIGGGERARSKGLAIFAHGLVGAGLAILYLSLYAAYNFYQLVPQPIALAAMSIVTTLAFIQALRYNALAISLLGWAGGFLTPFLLASDQASAVGLFAYILLLDIGLIAVSWKRKSWVILELLTRAATYVVYGLWYVNSYTPSQFGVAMLFLLLFWGLFYLLDLAHVLKKQANMIELRHLIAATNTLVYYASLYSLVNGLYPDWTAAVTLAFGALYFGTALALRWRRPDHTDVHAQYILTAVAALVLATELQFSGFPTVIAWSLEALALLWCGQRWRLSYVRYSALGIFALALLRLLITPGTLGYTPIETFTLLLNQRALAFAVLVLSLATSTLLFRDRTRLSDLDVSVVLHVAWSVLLLGLLTIETNDSFRYLLLSATSDQTVNLRYVRPLTIAVLWLAFSLPLAWAGLKTTARSLMNVGVGTACLAIGTVALFGFLFQPIAQFQLMLNLRFAAFALVIGGVWLHARALDYQQQHMPRLWYTLCALLIFELITVEVRDVFGREILAATIQNAWATRLQLQNLQQLAISSGWLIYASVLIGLGFWRRVPALRMGAILLAGITVIKIFIYDLAFLETLYRIFSFISLGLILLGVSYIYQRYRSVIFGTPVPPTPAP